MKTKKSLIEPALAKDAPVIAALLATAGLPHEDVPPHLVRFFVARDEGGRAIGAVGAEVCGPDALLRSLVVAPEHRGSGLGSELVNRIEIAAATWGVERWWLLTTTAETFFRAQGFGDAERSTAPVEIQRTRQFSGGCCAAAVCLTRDRRAAP